MSYKIPAFTKMRYNQTMRRKLKINSIVMVILLILLTIGIFINFNNYSPYKNKLVSLLGSTTETTKITEESKMVTCTRATRLENQPQYDRALSLINQRLSSTKLSTYKQFPAGLTNCIEIIEEITDKSSNIEGYFYLNSEDIKSNYYPIVVNVRYQEADDVVIALLLIHEINHVQQYMDIQNGKTSLSCVETEIESFLAQRDFWAYLNTEEAQSLLSRNKSDDSLHPQIKTLFSMLGTHPESGCKDFWDFKCYDDHVHNELEQIIISDSYYRKQCNL